MIRMCISYSSATDGNHGAVNSLYGRRGCGLHGVKNEIADSS